MGLILNTTISQFSNSLHSLVFGFYRQLDLVGIGFRFINFDNICYINYITVYK